MTLETLQDRRYESNLVRRFEQKFKRHSNSAAYMNDYFVSCFTYNKHCSNLSLEIDLLLNQ